MLVSKFISLRPYFEKCVGLAKEIAELVPVPHDELEEIDIYVREGDGCQRRTVHVLHSWEAPTMRHFIDSDGEIDRQRKNYFDAEKNTYRLYWPMPEWRELEGMLYHLTSLRNHLRSVSVQKPA